MSSDIKSRLNERLPYESVVRWPSLQSLGQVPENYHRNCIDLDNFLKRSFGFCNGDTSGARMLFTDGLRDVYYFTQWILQSHKIMCNGADEHTYYLGMSKGFPLNHRHLAGKLRNDSDSHNGRVSCELNEGGLHNIFLVAAHYGDVFVMGHKDFLSWEQQRLKEGLLMAFPLPCIDDLILDKWGGTIGSYTREDLPELPIPVMVSGPYSETALYLFPASRFLPEYLNAMQTSLKRVFDSIASADAESTLKEVAAYYQVGIRSQMVFRVWNSVLMAQVNAIIDNLGFHRMPHRNLDLQALGMSWNTFQMFFADLVTGKIKIEDPYKLH